MGSVPNKHVFLTFGEQDLTCLQHYIILFPHSFELYQNIAHSWDLDTAISHTAILIIRTLFFFTQEALKFKFVSLQNSLSYDLNFATVHL